MQETPAHYDRVEEENKKLHKEIEHLKYTLQDMEAELEVWRSSGPPTDLNRIQRDLDRIKEYLTEDMVLGDNSDEEELLDIEEDTAFSRSVLQKYITKGERVLQKMDTMKEIVANLKFLDTQSRSLLMWTGTNGEEAQRKQITELQHKLQILQAEKEAETRRADMAEKEVERLKIQLNQIDLAMQHINGNNQHTNGGET